MCLDIAIEPPIFDWNRGAPKFLEMVHGVLGPETNVNPGDFTVPPANEPGEVVARYNVFGGNGRASLYATRLSMDLVDALLEQFSRVFESCTMALGLEWKIGI